MQESHAHARRWGLRLGAVALMVAATVGWSVTTSGATDRTIRTEGGEQFQANVKISSNLRFSPGQSGVRTGGTIHLAHNDATEEPHTLTIVDAAEVPSTGDDVFSCGEPGTVCDDAFQVVGPQIVDEGQAQFVNVAGGSGLDSRLDTVWLPAGTSIDVPVTAAPGTTLRYMCVIHAWMQGTINVS